MTKIVARDGSGTYLPGLPTLGIHGISQMNNHRLQYSYACLCLHYPIQTIIKVFRFWILNLNVLPS